MESVLVTPRLQLRRLSSGDAALMLELMNEPPYYENIGDRGVRSAADARRYIEEKYISSYETHGYGLYLVELKDGLVPVGICGLVRRKTLDHPDVGFATLQRHWSKGYALEAARATLDFARGSLGLPFVYGVVTPKNARSIRLLERLGLRYQRTIEAQGNSPDSLLYGIELGTPKPLTV
jgi:ribosomal-protein-alanine N-acetyltransferase